VSVWNLWGVPLRTSPPILLFPLLPFHIWFFFFFFLFRVPTTSLAPLPVKYRFFLFLWSPAFFLCYPSPRWFFLFSVLEIFFVTVGRLFIPTVSDDRKCLGVPVLSSLYLDFLMCTGTSASLLTVECFHVCAPDTVGGCLQPVFLPKVPFHFEPGLGNSESPWARACVDHFRFMRAFLACLSFLAPKRYRECFVVEMANWLPCSSVPYC